MHATNDQEVSDLAEGSSPRMRKRKSFDGLAHASTDLPQPAVCMQFAPTPSMLRPDYGADGEPKPYVSKAGWMEHEDQIVQAAVRALGTQWQAVADQLPGRTADAVRNRWHRLQKKAPAGRSNLSANLTCEGQNHRGQTSSPLRPSSEHIAPDMDGHGTTPPLHYDRSRSGHIDPSLIPELAERRPAVVVGSDHGRTRWSAEEDQAIERGVRTLGPRWRQIAATLPGRSDSSIRNRWHRLMRGSSHDEPRASPPPQSSNVALPQPAAPTSPELVMYSSPIPMPPSQSVIHLPPPTNTNQHPLLQPQPLAYGMQSAPAMTPCYNGGLYTHDHRMHACSSAHTDEVQARNASPSSSASRSPPPTSSSPQGSPQRLEANSAGSGDRALALALVAFASQNLGRDEDPNPKNAPPAPTNVYLESASCTTHVANRAAATSVVHKERPVGAGASDTASSCEEGTPV